MFQPDVTLLSLTTLAFWSSAFGVVRHQKEIVHETTVVMEDYPRTLIGKTLMLLVSLCIPLTWFPLREHAWTDGCGFVADATH